MQLIEIPVADRALEARAAVVIVGVATTIIVVDVITAAWLVAAGRSAGNDLFEKLCQFFRLDLEELDVHFRYIDRGHRQATVLRRWQNHAAAGEVEGRRNGCAKNREARFLLDLAAVVGHQAGLDAYHVAHLRLDMREKQQVRVFTDDPGAGDRLAAFEFGILG
ncbi:MAG: hypothetical protein AW10_00908 [Candidatus Accumulibacter appositus]|uniref:Uncharacterized protein n=1 Tax=Candidatus Accumulibacter appositus TaxID=1454003 RepID=A0A011NGX7_9PROT|nr:MAG: hypothetical protein AW10_00908 [Candidatus Accumulibacter appositus]